MGENSSSWETTLLHVMVSLRYSRVLPTSRVFRSGYKNVYNMEKRVIFLKYEPPCNQLVPILLQFLAHPVVYNLLHDKWYGEFVKFTNRKWTEPKWWKWIFLNLWLPLDVVLFPLIYLVFWICRVVTKFIRVKRGMLMYKR